MEIANELLQGIIAAAIVALIVTLCCIFYWCKLRKRKALRNATLERVAINSQSNTIDAQQQPTKIKLKKEKWQRQERRIKLQEIIQEHQQSEGHQSQALLRHYNELDLHNYTLKEAMETFELFLAVSLDDYEDTDRVQNRFIEVITGRGKHSKDGIPVIKMAVSEYLDQHSYTHSWPNPGMVRIDLFSKKQMLLQANGRKSFQRYLGCSVA